MKLEDVRVGMLVWRRGDPKCAIAGEVVRIDGDRVIVRWELESEEWAYAADELEPAEVQA